MVKTSVIKQTWTGAETTADGKLALQVGATYTKEVMPGYVVKIKVKSLKPFQATELYKKTVGRTRRYRRRKSNLRSKRKKWIYQLYW